MAERIENLLQTRADLSPYLIHFTRDTDSPARVNLLSILDGGTIDAKTDFGMAKALVNEFGAEQAGALDGAGLSQKVVCFTETPLEHCSMMVKEIVGRSCRFTSYGIVFTKSVAKQRDCNPVWYLNMDVGNRSWLTKDVNVMVEDCINHIRSGGKADPAKMGRYRMLRLFPFMEQTLGVNKDFSWEREWRCRGDFVFGSKDVSAVFAPEAEHDDLSREIRDLATAWKTRDVPILDPTWSLERMMSILDT
ncbi:UNVERIFIED_ORG: abortive phage resistance protein AbiGi (putative antitoxin) [Nocardia globerula]|uniref:Abortive phage resistance protein AbiGi (Putative antitoxin) n=1 Tax=Nocardia globerula TaxID=1818 RepID=A0A652YWW9_NOCGL|nr:abortive infection system antitoxin AbiGi family protein [Rhodococcus globerulus]NMD59424.1 hypothetical protein [Nocardia globerula]PVX64501.1 abortive phage resistance protein AbiGi (putative antitoxin) [Rhodococcus globerulus]